jgi:hypothetical protein
VLVKKIRRLAVVVPLVLVMEPSFSIIDFRAGTMPEAKKPAVERIFDNSLLREIQKENGKTK